MLHPAGGRKPSVAPALAACMGPARRKRMATRPCARRCRRVAASVVRRASGSPTARSSAPARDGPPESDEAGSKNGTVRNQTASTLAKANANKTFAHYRTANWLPFQRTTVSLPRKATQS
eukprot:355782-Chlamydomonas_euryale.AAC.6